jgi:TetR/AcrR family transcriptional regulator, cholesterol catabolism regulator
MADDDRPADARRREIVEQAAALFDARGYFGTNLEDVAAAVGLRKASLYHYFTGKDDILRLIHTDFLAWTMEREERRRAYDLPPAQHLLEIVSDTLEVIGRRPGHVRVFIEHYRDLDDETRRHIVAERERYTTMVEEVIRQGVETGAFRPMDPRLGVLALFGACNWSYQWYRPSDEESPRDTAMALWDILMRGVSAAPAAA